MGRNRKDGFEYHTLDSAIRNDIKVRRLTKVGGAEATLSYIYILGYIYEKGYYAVFNDELVFDISDSLYCDEENINKHLELFFRFELFDKTIFDKYKVLTSHGLQERYKKMCKSVNRICIMDDYNLLEISSEEGENKDGDISSDKLPISSEFPLYIKEKEENILLSNDSVQNSDSGAEDSAERIIPPIREKPDYEKVVGLWHDICKSYPRVTKLTDKRKKKIDQRMKELDWDYEQLKLIFGKMEASSFMRGGSWASFDWVFTSEGNMTKVLEGNYDDKTGTKTFQQVNKDVNDLWANR